MLSQLPITFFGSRLMLLINYAIGPSTLNTTTPAAASPDSPDGSQQIAASIGVTVGVVGTTIVAVTVCCIWSCHWRRYATQFA